MPHITEVSHPLIKHHLARLRDATTTPFEFRQLIQRLSALLAYEATQDLTLRGIEFDTPLVRTKGYAWRSAWAWCRSFAPVWGWSIRS
jgi:uracil phosphoribosyltransferase